MMLMTRTTTGLKLTQHSENGSMNVNIQFSRESNISCYFISWKWSRSKEVEWVSFELVAVTAMNSGPPLSFFLSFLTPLCHTTCTLPSPFFNLDIPYFNLHSSTVLCPLLFTPVLSCPECQVDLKEKERLRKDNRNEDRKCWETGVL